jgi:predicted AAA+ superfamily ATPase
MLSSARAWLTGKTGYDISDDFRLNNAGYLIETIVAQHLIVANEAPLMRQPDTFLWFHYNTRELDFVYKTRTDEFIGIETAYQHSPRPSDAARVPQIKKYFLLTQDEYDEFKKDPALFMIPASLFLAVLDRGEHNL